MGVVWITFEERSGHGSRHRAVSQWDQGCVPCCTVTGGVGGSSALIFIQCVGSFAQITTETMWKTGVATACGTLKVHISQKNM